MTFDEYWHAQPFGWAACDSKTLSEKCFEAGKLEAAQHILDVFEKKPWNFYRDLKAYVGELK